MLVASPAEENGEMEETGQKFGAFPFKPYSIQIDFMNALYDSLDKGGIAMLESPTGNLAFTTVRSVCVCVELWE